MMKISSIFLLSIFLVTAFIPEVSAKRCCRNRSSFGLSFNMAPAAPSYVVEPAPVVVQPAPVAVMPYNPYVAAPAYPYYTQGYYAPTYYAPRPVVVERHAPNVYVQPGFSFSYRR